MRMLLVYYVSKFRLALKSWIWVAGAEAWAKRLHDAFYAVTACDFNAPKESFGFPY
jgi:hypothetical protein